MQYIDRNKIEEKVDAEWAAKAAKAHGKAAALAGANRSKYIRRASIWRELTEGLAGISHNKCWYCECDDIRSDRPVDHYRPANAVKECNGHPGYWWLAYDPLNYRYCCTFCNSRRIDEEGGTAGGKAHHFPLVDEGNRANNETDDIGEEVPILLDPTDPLDPKLLWFTTEGLAEPRYSDDENEIANKRADKSIELYHLNHKGITQERKKMAIRVRTLVKRGEKSKGDSEQLKDIMRDLCQLIDKEAPFSASAKSYLKNYKAHPWVEIILE